MSDQLSRRHFARALLLNAALATEFVKPSSVAALQSPFTAPENLIARFAQKAPPRPKARLFEEDIFYPDYFAGVWETESKLISVMCPAGYKLFGRPGSFESAQRVRFLIWLEMTLQCLHSSDIANNLDCDFPYDQEVNNTVKYRSRFVRIGKHVVADRLFNVRAIAEATMGPQSVLDCDLPTNTPNRVFAAIRPNGADGGVFLVSMKALARQQQEGPLPNVIGDPDVMPTFMPEPLTTGPSAVADVEGFGLYTSEMVRQEVRPDTEDLRVAPSIKEVETTTLFITKATDGNHVEAWQKTSSYLTRSNLQYVDTHGRPTDVRLYKLKYTRGLRR